MYEKRHKTIKKRVRHHDSNLRDVFGNTNYDVGNNIKYNRVISPALTVAIFVRTMAVFIRQITRTPVLLQQCARLAATQNVSKRGYADMAFTMASPSDVSQCITTLRNYRYHENKCTCQTFQGQIGLFVPWDYR